MNLVDVLRAGADAGGWLDRPAYEVDGAMLTHADVYTGAGHVAGALAGSGVRPGDRVALVLDDGPDFVLTFLGAVHAGAVAAPVNPRLHPDELRQVLRAARPALVVGRPGFSAAGFPVTTFAELDGAEPIPVVPRAVDDPVYATFTSGTTGVPRLCPQLHGDPIIHHRSFAVPALELNVFNDGQEKSRLILQFAAIQANSIYTISPQQPPGPEPGEVQVPPVTDEVPVDDVPAPSLGGGTTGDIPVSDIPTTDAAPEDVAPPTESIPVASTQVVDGVLAFLKRSPQEAVLVALVWLTFAGAGWAIFRRHHLLEVLGGMTR